jgi:ATP-dependent DNA helicase RecQ
VLTPEPNPSTVVVEPGELVVHKLWGAGTVLTVDEHELVVAFESVGYRHLTPAVLANGLVRPA